MNLAAFGVRKPVVANLVMVGLVAVGVVLGSDLRQEFFPEVRPETISVSAPYPGATPSEVESSLAIKIEDAVSDLASLKEMTTVATEGAATVMLELRSGEDIKAAAADVRRRVDALRDLPERAENIVVDEIKPRMPAIILTLYGDTDERSLKDSIREIQDDLLSMPQITALSVSGFRADEIAVEVRPGALVEHGVSLTDVARRVSEAMEDIPAGSVRTPTSNVSVRITPHEQRADRVGDIAVVAEPGGSIVRLREIAEVREGFTDSEYFTRLNGAPCASITVYSESGQDTVEISDIVKAYRLGRLGEPLEPTLNERLRAVIRASASPREQAYELASSRGALPGDLEYHTDLARFITQRLQLLSRNAMWGAGLVFLTLLLLLAPRVAWWVTIGLAVSLLGALAAMQLAGMSLNLLTMFGLIIVMGLLVDDAIIVAENIAARVEAGEPPLKAAVSGTRQVEWPVIATVLTTICAFLPLRIIEGSMGDLLGALPLVVMCALLVSLIEALFILPVHIAHSLENQAKRKETGSLASIARTLARFRVWVFEGFLGPRYERLLRWSLRRRWLSTALAVAALIVSAGMIAGGRLSVVFFETSDSETVTVEVRMPVGTPIAQTNEAVKVVEEAVNAAPEIRSVFALVGGVNDPEGRGGDIAQPHLAQFFLELHPVEDRVRQGQRTSRQMIDGIQRSLEGKLPSVRSMRFEEIQGGPSGAGINLAVTGDTEAEVLAAVRGLKAALWSIDGVHSVSDDADSGAREFRLRLRDGASELGFTVAEVARQVRAAVYGAEPHTFAGRREDVDVRVMLEEETRRSLTAIEEIYLTPPGAGAGGAGGGGPTPLMEIAQVSEGYGYATVRRLNRQRSVTVSADVDSSVLKSPEKAMEAMRRQGSNGALSPLGDVLATHPNVQVRERGRQKDMREAFSSLPLGMAAAVGMIYIVLAWLFSSYTKPVVVLAAVPFASIGVVWGHLLMGYSATFLSMIGFVALTGIVVNDALVFMGFYNQERERGLCVYDALMGAGRARLRAIVLTTLTTVLGLSPMMLEQSFQARFLIPMALTISFGLIATTVVVLVVLPCFVLCGDDVRRVAKRLWTGRPPSPEPVPVPAVGAAA